MTGHTDRLGGIEQLDRAVALLRAGRLVAFPTETVYGLGADAANPEAVRRIFAAKGRPADHPLIVHLAGLDQLDSWANDLSDAAVVLAEACWPGPLTLLVERRRGVLDEVTGGRSTVGLRVPAHRLASELLTRFGGGIAAPSANRFGRVSPTTAADVLDDLGDAVDLVLDGGPCEVGVESTIVDTTVDPPQVLRAGGITVEQIEALLPSGVALPSGASRAPGMLAAHYAPRCAVRLAESRSEAERLVAAVGASSRTVELLDLGEDLVRAARELYREFRAADRRGVEVLVVVLPPARGLGWALRDRLSKAAAAG